MNQCKTQVPYLLKTSVLFIVFNRFETTKQVFMSIKKARPPKLYIASDGPRDLVEGEIEKVNYIRNFINSNIDWDCEVKTLYRDQNLGCKLAVSGAIDWLFENEDMGIILEDDCLPTNSFFQFMEESLERYQKTLSVLMVSGYNGFNFKIPFSNDIFKSKFCSVWGWGTWRDRWLMYDLNIKSWNKYYNQNDLSSHFYFNFVKNKFVQHFDDVRFYSYDTWDFQLQYLAFSKNLCCLYPKINQVENIGFVGAHSTGKTYSHKVKANEFFDLDYKIIKPSYFYDFMIELKYLFIMLKSFLYDKVKRFN